MPPDNDVQKEIEQLEQRYAENSQGLVFAHLADAYRRAGQFAKAEGLILHGLKFHPSYISAFNVLGRVYVDSERYSDAHDQFSKVLELDPHNMIAMRALGDLAVRGGRLEDARSWYERMLQLDPRHEGAQEELQKLEAGDTSPPPSAEVPPEPAASEEVVAAAPPEEAAAPAEDVTAPSPGPSAETPEEPPQAAPMEGLGGSEEPEAPIPDEPSPKPASRGTGEIDLGELDDWTAGFLGEEDMEGHAGEDLGVSGLREEFGGQDQPEPVVEDLGDEVLGGEPEEAAPAGEGMVTETMAELYADQGLYEDALGVYQELAGTRPEDERIRARIAELEQQVAQARTEPEGDVDLAALLELKDVTVPEGPGPLEELIEPELPSPEPVAPPEPLSPHEAPPAFEEDFAAEAPEPRPAFEEESAAEATEPPAGIVDAPALGISDVEAAGAGPTAGSAGEAAAGEFEFDDEAPVAGIEHLDPFAASFDVMVKPMDVAPEPAGIADLADQAEPEPSEPEPPAFEAAEPELEIVPTIEEVPPDFEVEPAADVLPPGAELAPSLETAEREPEVPEPAEAPAPAVPVAQPLGAPTIEEYLSGLLDFERQESAAAPDAGPVATPAPSEAPPEAPAETPPPPSEPAEASSAPEPSDESTSDDLEQFQEWLRGLKE
jgi:tetratricopeptide (TPR) repeat protein